MQRHRVLRDLLSAGANICLAQHAQLHPLVPLCIPRVIPSPVHAVAVPTATVALQSTPVAPLVVVGCDTIQSFARKTPVSLVPQLFHS